jgi:hypothetical protein
MIIQSTNHLLNIIRAGYSIHAAGGVIKISPAQYIDDEMASLIRTHKTALIKLLESEVKHG